MVDRFKKESEGLTRFDMFLFVIVDFIVSCFFLGFISTESEILDKIVGLVGVFFLTYFLYIFVKNIIKYSMNIIKVRKN